MSKKTKRAESPKIVELCSGNDEIVGTIPTISAQPIAKKIRQKYEDIRRQKTLKLLRLKGKGNVLIYETKPVFTKNAHIAAKKICDKYNKMRNKKAIDLVHTESPKIVELPSDDNEIIGTVSNISAQPAAKKIRQKYKDIRRKKALKLLRLSVKGNILMNETKPVSTKMLV